MSRESEPQTPLIPAQAGIQSCQARNIASLDPRLRVCEEIEFGSEPETPLIPAQEPVKKSAQATLRAVIHYRRGAR